MIKSVIRLIACAALFTLNFQLTAVLLFLAEVLGIVEEI